MELASQAHGSTAPGQRKLSEPSWYRGSITSGSMFCFSRGPTGQQHANGSTETCLLFFASFFFFGGGWVWKNLPTSDYLVGTPAMDSHSSVPVSSGWLKRKGFHHCSVFPGAQNAHGSIEALHIASGGHLGWMKRATAPPHAPRPSPPRQADVVAEGAVQLPELLNGSPRLWQLLEDERLREAWP